MSDIQFAILTLALVALVAILSRILSTRMHVRGGTFQIGPLDEKKEHRKDEKKQYGGDAPPEKKE